MDSRQLQLQHKKSWRDAGQAGQWAASGAAQARLMQGSMPRGRHGDSQQGPATERAAGGVGWAGWLPAHALGKTARCGSRQEREEASRCSLGAPHRRRGAAAGPSSAGKQRRWMLPGVGSAQQAAGLGLHAPAEALHLVLQHVMPKVHELQSRQGRWLRWSKGRARGIKATSRPSARRGQSPRAALGSGEHGSQRGNRSSRQGSAAVPRLVASPAGWQEQQGKAAVPLPVCQAAAAKQAKGAPRHPHVVALGRAAGQREEETAVCVRAG